MMKLKELLEGEWADTVTMQMKSAEQLGARMAAGITNGYGAGISVSSLASGSFFEQFLASSPKSRKAATELGWLQKSANYKKAKLTPAGKKMSPDDMISFSKMITKLEKKMGGKDTAPRYTSKKEELFVHVKLLQKQEQR